MKKVVIILILSLFLAGCGAETFENVEDENLQPVMQPQKEMKIAVEEGALMLESDGKTFSLSFGR